MDVLCVGMYRACSTWQYEVVSHLVERHRDGRRLGYLTGEQYAAMERRDPAGEAWRVIKSHEEHPRFASALAEGRAIAVYGFRDLRDVVYSMLHKRGVTFETFLRQGMIHQILANDRFWSRQPRRITQRYEDLIDRPAEGVEGLAAHLEIALEPGEASEVASEYSLEANRRRTEQMASRLVAQGVDLRDPANLQTWDEQTLLHWNHVREGRVGDWRDRATPGERLVLARLANGWLAAHGYEPDRLPVNSVSLGDSAVILRGWLACRLRCASLRHPGAARVVKRILRVPTDGACTTSRPEPIAPAPHLLARVASSEPARSGSA